MNEASKGTVQAQTAELHWGIPNYFIGRKSLKKSISFCGYR